MEEKLIKRVLTSIKNNKKIEDDSFLIAGPFSYIGLVFDNKISLKIKQYVRTIKVKFWFDKYEKYWGYSLKDIKKDKTIEITETQYIKILSKLKNIDTDTVSHFLNYKVNRNLL